MILKDLSQVPGAPIASLRETLDGKDTFADEKGDVVKVKSVCYRGKYEIAVEEQCAFYELEGYFEVQP